MNFTARHFACPAEESQGDRHAGRRLQLVVFYIILYFDCDVIRLSQGDRMPKRADDLRELRLQKRLTQGAEAAKLKVASLRSAKVTIHLSKPGESRGEIAPAKLLVVNRMRLLTDRTERGGYSAGRRK